MKKLFAVFVFLLMALNNFLYSDEKIHEDSYAKILKLCVKSGNKIDYDALAENKNILENYLHKIAETDCSKLNNNEKLALFINAYNAYTLKIVLNHYPLISIKQIKGVWNKLKFKVCGRNYTLNQIKYLVVKGKFSNPKAVFCLFNSCVDGPPLRSRPYNGESIENEIEEQLKNFINNKRYVRYDEKDNILYISSIFKWNKKYLGDYMALIRKYAQKELISKIDKNKPKVKFLPFDWILNKAS